MDNVRHMATESANYLIHYSDSDLVSPASFLRAMMRSALFIGEPPEMLVKSGI